ncbi:MAG: hypothetical protein JWL59_2048 [Chthoniobacteraceae bacterium]|nr:hypothetical protein [Chthoniobacteraceae bacterium]
MKHVKFAHGFTLIEMLAAVALLSIFGILLLNLVEGTLRSVDISLAQMALFANARALSDALENDLARVSLAQSTKHTLGLFLEEDGERVRLAFSLPVTRVTSIEQFGPVAHVVYLWDKKTKQLSRAEFHAERHTDLVRSTGSDPAGADYAANESRSAQLAPAYLPDAPGEWLDDARMEAELQSATPLLKAVADLEFTCFTDTARKVPQARNSWSFPDRLPAVVRLRARLAANESANISGQRLIELLIPVLSMSEAEIHE